ncbi:DsbA family protein [Aliikangiella sp. IMCC44359]|uniref:DsbA family protein n=1 Tax=Aliikangiella sp. IMCC44359 TaxID=3459125 RepID=UPI00403A8427
MLKSQLIYVTDPLCLWCYGIAPTLEKFYAKLPNNITCTTINGGLFPGAQSKVADSNFRNYLKTASKKVTELTGQKFSDAFWKRLETPGFRYDTEPSARATVVVKYLTDDSTMRKYMHELQLATFVEGLDPTKPEILASIAQKFDIQKEAFLAAYQKPSNLKTTQDEYLSAKQMGVQGYPALIYVKENKGYNLISGYAPLEQLNQALAWAMDKCGDKPDLSTNACNDNGCTI